MRRCLYIDVDAGICEHRELPPELCACGGRALSSLLAAMHPDSLCIAPGLLADCRCASAGRCSVSCSDASGAVRHSNAGGTAGGALARAGLAAVVIRGASSAEPEERRVPLYDLVIGPSQTHLVPSSGGREGVSERMRLLAERWPDAAALITAGNAGEALLPVASLSFSDHRLALSSHAGSGSGALLCRKGLRSLVILRAEGPEHAVDPQGLENAVRAFVRILRERRAGAAASVKGCTSACVLACHENSSPAGRADGGKWPGHAEYWSMGDAERDDEDGRRFVRICDELGADAFALGRLLMQATDAGQLAKGDAEAALRELETLGMDPKASILHDAARHWQSKKKRSAGGSARQDMVMDCLGICRFAADALEQSAEARAAVADMVRCRYGWGAEALEAMADRGLAAEEGTDVPVRREG